MSPYTPDPHPEWFYHAIQSRTLVAHVPARVNIREVA